MFTQRFLTSLFFLQMLLQLPSMAGEAHTWKRLLPEKLPDRIQASKEAYYDQVKAAGSGLSLMPHFLIVPTLQRWRPGSVVRVAFEEGSPELHARIAEAANRWVTTSGANVRFSFKDNAGNFRKWSSNDSAYAAEIRIRFTPERAVDAGYWSHVGRDSINRKIDGGGPGQASMQFDSFHFELPEDWDTVVLHEFGHALGFEHEHQNPEGGCDFRFLDDPGYIPTLENGVYTKDASGRRPGLYTFLNGEPNKWEKDRTDANLGQLKTSSAFVTGSFDKYSIMKYFFDAGMFVKGENSACYTRRDANLKLSPQDIAGIKLAYPSQAAGIAFANSLRTNTIGLLRSSSTATQELKGSLDTQLKSAK